MVMIKEYDEDSLYNAAQSFLKTKGFKEYFNKQIAEIRKHYSGHKLEEEEFDLSHFYLTGADDKVVIIINFNVKPSRGTAVEILTDRWYEDDGEEEIMNDFNLWTNDLSEKVKEVVWAAVYNYPVLRVVNGGFDSIPLGDFADFDIIVKSVNTFDFSDISY